MAIDSHDISILRELQRDATLSVEELSARINLSRNACWRRVKLLEEAGIIKARVALVAPEKVNAGLTVLIQVRTAKHSAEWADRFRAALAALPEIVGAYRTAGEIDYILKARVPDVAAYDRLYQRLIARIEMDDVSASFVMEALTDTTEVPLTYA
ncbi:MAG: Lrp/AsnC family transcriptional regulator [Bosea sp. (in: a-proteobacteria)]